VVCFVLCLALRPPQFPRNSKPHNSSTLPRNPSSRGRVKLHCLRPLPPPYPAPARPLRGIWLGAGVVSSLGTDPGARLSTSTPGGAPAPVAVPSAAPHGRLGEQLPPLPLRSVAAPSGRSQFPLLFWGPRVPTTGPPGADRVAGDAARSPENAFAKVADPRDLRNQLPLPVRRQCAHRE
jgi:hypothetical protein